MSEKLCTLRTLGGGGGGSATWVETILWANQSPTSDFAAQTITLSDGMSNYDYLAIAFTAHKTSTDAVRTIISVIDFGKLENVLNKPQVRFGGYNSTPTAVTRQFLKVSDTSISIGNAYYINTSGSSNSYAIPIQVVGIKMNGTITPSTLDLSMPPNASGFWNSVSAGATKTVATTQTPKFIAFYEVFTGGGMRSLLLDVENETCYEYGYYSSAWHLNAYPNWSNKITSITSSSVTIKNTGSSTNYMAVGIYY